MHPRFGAQEHLRSSEVAGQPGANAARSGSPPDGSALQTLGGSPGKKWRFSMGKIQWVFPCFKWIPGVSRCVL